MMEKYKIIEEDEKYGIGIILTNTEMILLKDLLSDRISEMDSMLKKVDVNKYVSINKLNAKISSMHKLGEASQECMVSESKVTSRRDVDHDE